MIETDKVWLACAIDGEGSIIGAFVPSNEYPSLSMYIQVANTVYEFVEKALELTNGRLTTIKKATKNLKTMYIAKLHGFEVLRDLLEEIYPYLIVKKNQADIMLDWLDWRLSRMKTPQTVEDYIYYLMLRSLNDPQGRTELEIADKVIADIWEKHERDPLKYVKLVKEAAELIQEYDDNSN